MWENPKPKMKDFKNYGRLCFEVGEKFLLTSFFLLTYVSKVLIFFLIDGRYLVDPASSHMLVSKIKPCKS